MIKSMKMEEVRTLNLQPMKLILNKKCKLFLIKKFSAKKLIINNPGIALQREEKKSSMGKNLSN